MNQTTTANSESVEAMYQVKFGDIQAPNQYVNGGVVVLETGRVFGGDSGYYYLGEFNINQDNITVKAIIEKHDPTWHSAFGDNSLKFGITVNAKIKAGVIEGYMIKDGASQQKLPIRLKRIASLP